MLESINNQTPDVVETRVDVVRKIRQKRPVRWIRRRATSSELALSPQREPWSWNVLPISYVRRNEEFLLRPL